MRQVYDEFKVGDLKEITWLTPTLSVVVEETPVNQEVGGGESLSDLPPRQRTNFAV